VCRLVSIICICIISLRSKTSLFSTHSLEIYLEGIVLLPVVEFLYCGLIVQLHLICGRYCQTRLVMHFLAGHLFYMQVVKALFSFNRSNFVMEYNGQIAVCNIPHFEGFVAFARVK